MKYRGLQSASLLACFIPSLRILFLPLLHCAISFLCFHFPIFTTIYNICPYLLFSFMCFLSHWRKKKKKNLVILFLCVFRHRFCFFYCLLLLFFFIMDTNFFSFCVFCLYSLCTNALILLLGWKGQFPVELSHLGKIFSLPRANLYTAHGIRHHNP